MKAIAQDRYGSADVLQLREVAQPSIGKDQVLVRVRAAGVDPSVWICMTGRPYGVRVAFGMTRPRIAVRGRGLAGVVERVGADVQRFRPGDEVYGTSPNGTFAEYVAASWQHLAPKPPTASFGVQIAKAFGATPRDAARCRCCGAP
jgi:NADPH:quinone reductase-like Zn-dependent oxidoreductase